MNRQVINAELAGALRATALVGARRDDHEAGYRFCSDASGKYCGP